jgi:hypothetical protein
MTDMLREIEKGHEAKFKLDEELRFKVRCRAAKLFGLWAAERLGQAHEEAKGYAQRLVARCAEAPGAGVVLVNVGADFAAAGVKMGETDLLAAYARCHASAAEQFADTYPTPLDRDHSPVGG